MAEFEDEIINMFTGKKKNIEYELCHQLAGKPCNHTRLLTIFNIYYSFLHVGYCGRKKRSEL